MTRAQVAKKREEALAKCRRARPGDKLRSQGEVRAWTKRLLEMEVRAMRRAA